MTDKLGVYSQFTIILLRRGLQSSSCLTGTINVMITTDLEYIQQAASKALHCTTGDIIIASGCIAYFGAFPSNYRRELVVKWIDQCTELKIPASETFE